MVEDEPAWRTTPQHTLTLGYDHVHLLPRHVLGQWYCLERETGKVLWEKPISKADSVAGVSEGVIIATGTWESGASTSTFGVYGISLETGEVLWESHYSKPQRKSLLSRLLWFIPTVYADHPYSLRGSECLTEWRRVLDVRTGQELRREPSKEGWTPFWEDASPGSRLYRQKAVDCGEGRTLRHGTPGQPAKAGTVDRSEFRLFLTEPDGRIAWSFDLASAGHFLDGNYFSYRYSTGFAYLAVADRPPLVAVDAKRPGALRENPAQYFLWTLDVRTGQIVQKIPLTRELTTRCRIEDLDERALLLTCAGSVLYFARKSQTEA